MRPFLLALGIVILSCGRKEATEPEPTTMDSQTTLANSGVQLVSDADDYLTLNAWRGGFFVYKTSSSSFLPYPAERLFKQGCAPQPVGDTTDNDGDGIPKNAYIEIDCDTLLQNPQFPQYSMRYMMQGKVSAYDNDDNNVYVGAVSVNNPFSTDDMFAFRIEYPNMDFQPYFEMRFRYDVSTNMNAGTYSASVNASYRFSMRDTTGQDYVSDVLNQNLSFSFASDDPNWTPDSTYLRGSLDIQGTISYGNEQWSISTQVPLVYDGICFVENEPFPVSGVLTYTYQSNEMVVEITGCGKCNVIFNGQLITTCESSGPAF